MKSKFHLTLSLAEISTRLPGRVIFFKRTDEQRLSPIIKGLFRNHEQSYGNRPGLLSQGILGWPFKPRARKREKN